MATQVNSLLETSPLDSGYIFESETAGREYSFLSAMLGYPGTEDPYLAPEAGTSPDPWSSALILPHPSPSPAPGEQYQPMCIDQQQGSTSQSAFTMQSLSLPSPPVSTPGEAPVQPRYDLTNASRSIITPTLPGDAIYCAIVRPYNYTHGAQNV